MTYKDVWHVPPILPDKLQKRITTSVAPMKKQKKKLTQREWTFVQELVAGDGTVTMKECALRAGYTPKSAKAMAWRLTNPDLNPHVVAAIQEYRAELAAKYSTTFERHMRDLQTIRDAALAAGAYGAAVTAEHRRGQALGTIYVERKEIRHGTIDSMSKEEVERKLEEIKRLYGGPPPQAILDIQARDITEEKDPPFNPLEAIENVRDSETGDAAVSEAEGELAEGPDNET